MTTRISILFFLLIAPFAHADWFEDAKQSKNPEDLYRVLYHMPKGGDLHNHLSGSNFSEWWYELALAEKARGYHYYTKVRIDNCVDYGSNAYGRAPYFLLFRNITALDYAALSDCEKGEYKALDSLDDDERKGWLDSIRLDKPYEGREEFFGTHWGRLNVLTNNPWLQAETLVRNMQAFSEEGLRYLETQIAVDGFLDANGKPISPHETADIIRQRLRQADALATNVTVRLQIAVLRFTPFAEDQLKAYYEFVHDNSDLFVAVNMVGREDNDKGYPLRFLPTMRELRRQFDGVKLSIHAGEVDEPNQHVRDTLLLGADRIGHGVNLISDDDTMLLMRNSDYLVEINLISNLLLEYVTDYRDHPFPEYLRTNIPVALSTDDRGMWDSTMTDEFYVAVREFDLSWEEVKGLSENSLQYSFLADDEKNALVQDFQKQITQFERRMAKYGMERVATMPSTRQFICKHYAICH